MNQARSFPRECQVACSCRQCAVTTPKSSRGSRTREPPQGSAGGFSSAAAAPLRGRPQAAPTAAGLQLAGVWARRRSGPAPRSHRGPAVLVPRPEFHRSGRAPAAGVAAIVAGSRVPLRLPRCLSASRSNSSASSAGDIKLLPLAQGPRHHMPAGARQSLGIRFPHHHQIHAHRQTQGPQRRPQ